MLDGPDALATVVAKVFRSYAVGGKELSQLDLERMTRMLQSAGMSERAAAAAAHSVIARRDEVLTLQLHAKQNQLAGQIAEEQHSHTQEQTNVLSTRIEIGDLVEGLYPADNNWYPAHVAAIHSESQEYTLDWTDGDTQYRRLPASSVRQAIVGPVDIKSLAGSQTELGYWQTAAGPQSDASVFNFEFDHFDQEGNPLHWVATSTDSGWQRSDGSGDWIFGPVQGRPKQDAYFSLNVSAIDDSDLQTALAHVMYSLQGVCTTVSIDWWSYALCHYETVRQFHAESHQNKLDEEYEYINLGRVLNSANADLSFVSTISDDSEPRLRAAGLRVIHHFENGDHCSEAVTRHGSIQYDCYWEIENNIRSRCSDKSNCPDREIATIVQINEPQQCEYVLYVHVPEICKLVEDQTARRKITVTQNDESSSEDTDIMVSNEQTLETGADVEPNDKGNVVEIPVELRALAMELDLNSIDESDGIGPKLTHEQQQQENFAETRAHLAEARWQEHFLNHFPLQWWQHDLLHEERLWYAAHYRVAANVPSTSQSPNIFSTTVCTNVQQWHCCRVIAQVLIVLQQTGKDI